MTGNYGPQSLLGILDLALIATSVAMLVMFRMTAARRIAQNIATPLGAARGIVVWSEVVRVASALSLGFGLVDFSNPVPLRVVCFVAGVAGVLIGTLVSRPSRAMLAQEKLATSAPVANGDHVPSAGENVVRQVGASVVAVIAAGYLVLLVFAIHFNRFAEYVFIAVAVAIVSVFTVRIARGRFKSLDQSPEEMVRERPNMSLERARISKAAGKWSGALFMPVVGLAVLAYQILFAPPFARGQPAFTNTATSAAVISARLPGAVLVQATLNGTRVLWFALDSSSEMLHIDKAVADQAGLPTDASGNRTANVAVDPMRDDNAHFADTKAWQAQDGTPVAGFLGEPFFRSTILTIDFPRHQVIAQPKTFVPASTALREPLTFVGRLALVRATVNGKPLWLILDTRAYRSGIFQKDSGARHEAQMTIDFGGSSFPLTTVAVGDAPNWERYNVGGYLGRDVLHNFKITFDYANKALYLER